VTEDAAELDPRFSLANERTFLAWIRTALALIAGGVVAAKAVEFDHEALRWVVALPPVLAGAGVAAAAAPRWRTYEDAMRRGARLATGRGHSLLGAGMAVYAVVVLIAIAVDE
jgi:putative membrane protein